MAVFHFSKSGSQQGLLRHFNGMEAAFVINNTCAFPAECDKMSAVEKNFLAQNLNQFCLRFTDPLFLITGY